MKKIILAVCITLYILGSGHPVPAQSNDIDQFFPDFKADADMAMDDKIRNVSNKGVQFGGTLSPSIVYYHKNDMEYILTSVNSLHLWMKVYIFNNFYMYVRGKEVFTYKIKSEEFEGIDDIENLLDLDLAFFRVFNDSQLLNFSFGRKYFHLGSGLVFSGRADGFEFRFDSSVVDLSVFSAYTGLLHKDNNPYNINVSDSTDGSKRVFVGGTTEFDMYNQTFYLLGMAQIDFSDEEDDNRSRYNSQYYGLGMRGVAFYSLSYFGEFVYETGESYTSTDRADNSIRDIRAYAVNIGIEKYFISAMNPLVLFQYTHGSGDKDRYAYSGSEAANSNSRGNDTGFIGFGSFYGGYALRPVPGNLHVVRLGFGLSPFSETASSFRRMAMIAKYSLYLKDEKESVVNDKSLDLDPNRETLVGHGIDVALRWKIYYDFSAYLNYATIIPGDTYDDPHSLQNRHLVLCGVVLSL